MNIISSEFGAFILIRVNEQKEKGFAINRVWLFKMDKKNQID